MLEEEAWLEEALELSLELDLSSFLLLSFLSSFFSSLEEAELTLSDWEEDSEGAAGSSLPFNRETPIPTATTNMSAESATTTMEDMGETLGLRFAIM